MATRELKRIVIVYNDSLEAEKIRAGGTLFETIGGKERQIPFEYTKDRSQLTTGQQEYLDQIATFLNNYLNADEPLT